MQMTEIYEFSICDKNSLVIQLQAVFFLSENSSLYSELTMKLEISEIKDMIDNQTFT